MLLRGENILKAGGRFITITPDSDIVLKFTVQGTCFPAKVVQGSSNTTQIIFYSVNNVDNKVYIDFADGTGEHEYPFYASGSARRIQFRNLAGGTTPETIQGSGWYDAPVYFYQDLPEGVKNTVQDEYPQQRDITIRFEKPQEITYFDWYYMRAFGVIPSAISKMRNLEFLRITQTNFITAFAQDFYDSKIVDLILTVIGDVMEDGIPLWILNSSRLERLDLYGSVNLSGDPELKRLTQINKLKGTLKQLSIGNSGINYRLPESISELYKLESLNIRINNSPLMLLPYTLDTLVGLRTLTMYGCRLPFSEVERALLEIPNLVDLDICSNNYTADYNIEEDNYILESIKIGGQTWGTNNPPQFISKLKALKYLALSFTNSITPSNSIQGYGDFSECENIEQLDLYRLASFTTSIPAWFSVLTKLKNIRIFASFQNSGGIDSYVDNFYDFIVANASMSVGSTPFRNMTIDAYGTNISDQNNSTRPSGTYQQPSGYIQGSSNGTPASPMEKIWVLTNQYGHTWIVKPS